MMLAQKGLLSSSSCSSCRLALLRAFITSSSLAIQSTVQPRWKKTSMRDFRPSRSFGTLNARHLDTIHEQASGTPIVESAEEQGREGIPTEVQDSPSDASSVPWYLQVEPPRRLSNPLLERQQLPPLPPDPPPLLEPILEHVSKDIGLDDLTLLDLRSIDPPPALGANLLMAIGTARSEKHLHVSADRFCRWLKVTYGFSPYADGLLGRGELKLKLKRKARRAKIMRNAGSSETDMPDDGIRTGWICVNIGTIEDGGISENSRIEQDGYAGFGGESEGARLVVQMFTQEKREELDLEDLWGRMLKRQERKESEATKNREELFLDQEVRQFRSMKNYPIPDTQFSAHLRSPKQLVNRSHQIRQLHHHYRSSTSALNFSREDNNFISEQMRKGEEDDIQDENDDEDNQMHISRKDEQIEPTFSKRDKTEPDMIHLRPWQMKYSDFRTWRKIGTPEIATLKKRVTDLYNMSPDKTIKALGKGVFDRNSTPFLKSFYNMLPNSHHRDHWELLLALVSRGVAVQHPGYPKSHLFLLSQEMQSYIKPPPEKILRGLFRAFLVPDQYTENALPELTKESIVDAIMTLQAMYANYYTMNTVDTRWRLYRAALITFREGSEIRERDPSRLLWVLDTLNARLRNRAGYAECLRMLVESCEILQRDPNFTRAERLELVSAYLAKAKNPNADQVRAIGRLIQPADSEALRR